MQDNKKAVLPALNEVEDVYEVSVLLDFYGQLLTERQHELLDMHYNNDLSLGEIADEFGISRQGVHDSIRKSKAVLLAYEDQLKLVERFRDQEKRMRSVLECLQQVEKDCPEMKNNDLFLKAMNTLALILDTL